MKAFRPMALALGLLLAGCSTAHLTPEQREARRTAAFMMMFGQMQGYSAQQGAIATRQPMQPTTCMPVNRYVGGSGFTCY